MITWRLIKAKFAAQAFDGEGARLYGGRWNSPGSAVVYSSATASLAVLEISANVQKSELLSAYALVSCSFESDLITTMDLAGLPANWRQSPAPAELATIGDEWIRSSRSLVLATPSAIIDRENNYLINPNHHDFRRLEHSSPEPFVFDLRLLGKS